MEIAFPRRLQAYNGLASHGAPLCRRPPERHTMTTEQQIASVQLRLSKAQADQEAWRASGPQEKYLEAFCLAESLECELAQLEQQGRAEAQARRDR